MLLQFNLTNFMSFKNEAIISAIANKDKEHESYLIPYRKDNVLPCLSIYGSNASGKTNINKALVFAILFVSNSNMMQINDKINVIPFLLDENSRNNKSRFDFTFVYDNIKYDYGFVCDQINVYEEYLYEYNTNKPSMIFERTNINEYKYSTTTKKELAAIEGRNTNNKLFLSTATMWNASFTKNAFMWFEKGIDVYEAKNLEQSFINILEKDINSEAKNFMKKWLQNADMNIVDFELKVEKANPAEIQLPPGVQLDERLNEQLLNNLKKWELNANHKVIENGVTKHYQLPFQVESKGTMNLFYLGPIIKEALTNGKTIVIDEIDSGLHPILVRYLIGLFHDKKSNPNGAQLIFNTQDITQLSLNQFRRDQIYFVEKNNENGISDVYSLDEYAPRKSENVQKGYLQGRYGAMPMIGVDEDLW